ncbi:SulP family inorganic anion transporter [Pradoshia sp. D12]|uniref:SulP family inorganic anion transporter n=1 Tax=Bacillaceae TaxID=186817 RepID=UPI00080AE460|nr:MULTISPECIES: SulP family inorganic anion transporter [Bacillaceae]OCA82544.1 sulfate permease [Bacillus sp. FJAT-27986]QFK70248.1 SulP family inorganic anion transporter [Pradoshia sp. D12]TPF71028.1 SulP family inorganic anion transporter [Bacillus sp. D12]
MLKQYIHDLHNEFAGYNSEKLRKDIMAGITVTAVALPLSLAFGVSSGADAAAGLITAILAGLIISMLSGASYQISGPTGAMSAILIAVVAQYGLDGVFIACLLAGILLVIAGLLKFGRVVSIIPMPVITGFTSGIAIIIAMGQVDNFFGVESSGENPIAQIMSYIENGFNPDFATLLIGIITVVTMIVWPKKWNAIIPSSLAALLIVLIINTVLKLPVAVVGDIPKTFFPENRLVFSDLSLAKIEALIWPAISIAALGMIESLLCGASAGRMVGEKMNGDRELVAQGIGNMIIPFFGGVPATAAIARTSVAIKAGMVTRLTGIFHAIGLLLSMFLLSPIMSSIPMSALAGILIVTAWRMNEWESIHYIFSHKFKGAIFKFLLTLLATVVFDLTVAIVAGIVLSAILFVINSADVEMNVSKVDIEKLEGKGIKSNQTYEDIRVVYLTGPIFFATVSSLTERLEDINQGVMILSMRGVSSIDGSGVQAMVEFCELKKQEGVKIIFSGVQRRVLSRFERGGILDVVGEDNIFWSTDQALAKINQIQG